MNPLCPKWHCPPVASSSNVHSRFCRPVNLNGPEQRLVSSLIARFPNVSVSHPIVLNSILGLSSPESPQVLPKSESAIIMGWWDDFANNLATDLGPLISLFGEAPTKQYLSETTMPEDVVIFAMAPIGILTAVVSVIRVCGSPSLRAFIGRAQEGEGNAEVELCSSTSRNVSELYNNGGIARVFGNPQLLEIVFDPNEPKEGFYHNGQEEGRAGIHLSKDYFNNLKEDSEWTEENTAQGQDVEGGPGSLHQGKHFARKPNLSLNVGIQERSRPWFVATAILGIVLQSGVLVWAGFSRYNLQYIQSNSTADYAVPMIVSGTILVSFGVGLCARLVDKTTGERRFMRKKNLENYKSEIYWIQPGNQTIGDQTFDSFAYSDRSRSRYITSWKKEKPDETERRLTEAFVWVAILSTMIGFVAQFLGLRACHSSVSVAQLGVMLVMSVLRAWLRTQRLREEQNLMEKEPRAITGHELDWLALRLGNDGTQRKWSIAHVGTDHSKEAPTVLERNRISLCIGEEYQLVGFRQPDTNKEECGLTYTPEVWLKDLQSTREGAPSHEAAKTFLYRYRLAHITKTWTTTYLIAVRRTAEALAEAIEKTTDFIFATSPIKDRWKEAHTIYWPIKCALSGQPESSQRATEIFISLKRHIDSTGHISSYWEVDTPELEAVLGLQLWALNEHNGEQNQTEEKQSLQETHNMRILWKLPENSDFEIESMEYDIWRDRSRQPKIPKDESELSWTGAPKTCLRFGWHNISRSNQDGAKVRVLELPTNLSLRQLCAQDIFSLFFAAILHIIEDLEPFEFDFHHAEFPGSGIKPERNQLSHIIITGIQEAFLESKLGSLEDALACVIPVLKLQRRAPTLVQLAVSEGKRWKILGDLLSIRDEPNPSLHVDSDTESEDDLSMERQKKVIGCLLKNNASIECKKGQTTPLHLVAGQHGWEEIAKLLLEKCPDRNVKDASLQTALHCAAFSSTRSMAELLINNGVEIEARDTDGVTAVAIAVKWGKADMVDLFLEKSANLGWKDNKGDTLLHYTASPLPTIKPAHREMQSPGRILETIDDLNFQARKRIQEAHMHTLIREGRCSMVQSLLQRNADPNLRNHSGETPLHYAVQNQYISIVESLLEGKADQNLQNHKGETPLHNAAWKQSGDNRIVESLLRAKANPNLQGLDGSTPLHGAVRKEHTDSIESLLRGKADPNLQDLNGHTPLHYAASNEYTSIVKSLLEAKADPNLQNHEGETPLHYAACNAEIVKVLLDLGGDPAVKNNRGQTAQDVANETKLEYKSQKGSRDEAVELMEAWLKAKRDTGVSRTEAEVQAAGLKSDPTSEEAI